MIDDVSRIHPAAFARFQAGRRAVADIAVAARYGDDRPDTPQPGYVYPTGLFIAEIAESDPLRQQGRYYLIIGNMEYLDDDRTKLERILFDAFADEFVEIA